MVAYSEQQIQAAYEHCLNIVRSHYENFPVASMLLPARLRRPIAAIYAFARAADDFADEGNDNEPTRLEKLKDFENNINKINSSKLDNPIFIALNDVIRQHDLPISLFKDLLSAFKQDVTKHRYDNIDQVTDYCKRSANPVGRLLLHLIHEDSPENLAMSDSICSALQLINFLQDITQDYTENNRIYLPLDEMNAFGVSEKTIQQQKSDDSMRRLFLHQVQRARSMILNGANLGNNINGRFGLQLRMMINGGLQICKLLEKNMGNVYSRPRLTRSSWVNILYHSLIRKTIGG